MNLKAFGVAASLLLVNLAGCHEPALDSTGRVAPSVDAAVSLDARAVDASIPTDAAGDADAGPDADADAGPFADGGSMADAGAPNPVDAGDGSADAGDWPPDADGGPQDAGVSDTQLADAAVEMDAMPPLDGGPPPPPPPCVPEAATTYGGITVERQAAPAAGNWVRVAMVSWNSKDATRGATVQRATTDKNENLGIVDQFAAVAKKQCVDLLIFPEMSIVGYPTKKSDPNALKTSNFRSRAEAANYIEAIPPSGTTRANIVAANFPSSRRVADAAATNGVPIHVSLLEANGPAGKPYNTTLVFDKDGTLVTRHRKHNVIDPLPLNPGAAAPKFYYETEYLTAGDATTVYTHPKLGRVGVMTCADMYPRVDEDGKIVEAAPHWREGYLAGGGFSFMSVSSAWNDPWTVPFDPEWTAMAKVADLSAWANPNAKAKRWIGFSNTVSNGKETGKGFTALVAPVNDVKVQSDAEMRIVIGYVPAP